MLQLLLPICGLPKLHLLRIRLALQGLAVLQQVLVQALIQVLALPQELTIAACAAISLILTPISLCPVPILLDHLLHLCQCAACWRQ